MRVAVNFQVQVNVTNLWLGPYPYVPDPPLGGKILPILWSYGGGMPISRIMKKSIFCNCGTFGSFWDFAAKNQQILWEGMICSKLTPSQVSFC